MTDKRDDEILAECQALDAAYARAEAFDAAQQQQDDDEDKLDAYGHLNWTVGNEDWIACFDARRVGDEIEYHVVVDCESGGFTDTMERNTVPATPEGIAQLTGLPDYWASICSDHYLDVPNEEYGPIEWQETEKSWKAHLLSLLDPRDAYEASLHPRLSDPEADCGDEQSLDYFNRYVAGDR